MKIASISFTNYGRPNGHITFSGDGNQITLTLNEEDVARLIGLGHEIFQARQAVMAQSIADIKLPLLAGPDVQEGDWTEVNDA